MSKSKYFFLVDDDQVMTYVNILTIEIYDSDAIIVDYISSAKALSFLKKEAKENLNPPDIIFLDINMPELNGFEFLEKIKPLENSFLKNTEVYLLTSSLDKRDKEKAKNYSIVKGFLGKPLTEEMLKKIFS